jgi:2-methylcitrate dehydratase PrpD
VGERLGQFIAASRWEDKPSALRQQARRSLLNFIGCALGVANTSPIEMAMRVLTPLSGSERVTVLGRPERLDVLGASFLNAIGNLLDYDDTHLRTVIHPAAPVGPAALALAKHRGLSGADVLHALLLGVEVECRIGNAVSPGHYARGWHITSTCGVFGSAAASAKLLGLDAARTWHALGIAASQSAGNVGIRRVGRRM